MPTMFSIEASNVLNVLEEVKDGLELVMEIPEWNVPIEGLPPHPLTILSLQEHGTLIMASPKQATLVHLGDRTVSIPLPDQLSQSIGLADLWDPILEPADLPLIMFPGTLPKPTEGPSKMFFGEVRWAMGRLVQRPEEDAGGGLSILIVDIVPDGNTIVEFVKGSLIYVEPVPQFVFYPKPQLRKRILNNLSRDEDAPSKRHRLDLNEST